MAQQKSFFQIITEAVQDITLHGYSIERVDYWLRLIEESARASLAPRLVLESALKTSMEGIYRRYIERGQILKMHPGVSRFTIEQVKPKLRKELAQRIHASAQLIKLNREEAISNTLRRFGGWASSIPEGGSEIVEKREVKSAIRKSMGQLPYEERRVIIDQGYKFISALNDTIAMDGGAIAVQWHSHWRQINYDYRKDHKERDGKIYAIKGNWAMKEGLMKVGPAGYYEDITKPGEEVYCRCFAGYVYYINDLPEDMITQKGRDRMAAAREKMREMGIDTSRTTR